MLRKARIVLLRIVSGIAIAGAIGVSFVHWTVRDLIPFRYVLLAALAAILVTAVCAGLGSLLADRDD